MFIVVYSKLPEIINIILVYYKSSGNTGRTSMAAMGRGDVRLQHNQVNVIA